MCDRWLQVKLSVRIAISGSQDLRITTMARSDFLIKGMWGRMGWDERVERVARRCRLCVNVWEKEAVRQLRQVRVISVPALDAPQRP